MRLGRTSSDKCRLGRVVDPLSLQLAQAGHGLYFHVAVEGGKQTTEPIPPRRIFDTIGKFVKKKVIPTLPFPVHTLRVFTVSTRRSPMVGTKYK